MTLIIRNKSSKQVEYSILTNFIRVCLASFNRLTELYGFSIFIEGQSYQHFWENENLISHVHINIYWTFRFIVDLLYIFVNIEPSRIGNSFSNIRWRSSDSPGTRFRCFNPLYFYFEYVGMFICWFFIFSDNVEITREDYRKAK